MIPGACRAASGNPAKSVDKSLDYVSSDYQRITAPTVSPESKLARPSTGNQWVTGCEPWRCVRYSVACTYKFFVPEGELCLPTPQSTLGPETLSFFKVVPHVTHLGVWMRGMSPGA